MRASKGALKYQRLSRDFRKASVAFDTAIEAHMVAKIALKHAEKRYHRNLMALGKSYHRANDKH